jgi:hypothetical protein
MLTEQPGSFSVGGKDNVSLFKRGELDDTAFPHCGDGVCDPWAENGASCTADCPQVPASCGNGSCDPGETCQSCAGDCGPCPLVDARPSGDAGPRTDAGLRTDTSPGNNLQGASGCGCEMWSAGDGWLLLAALALPLLGMARARRRRPPADQVRRRRW